MKIEIHRLTTKHLIELLRVSTKHLGWLENQYPINEAGTIKLLEKEISEMEKELEGRAS